MPSLNFLLRAPLSVKRIVSSSHPYLKYMRGLIGEKNIATGIQLRPENMVVEGSGVLVANETAKLVSSSMMSSDLATELVDPLRLNVGANMVDIVTLTGHEDRFLFALMDKPVCITRRFKGFRLEGYSVSEKELVNALLNSLLMKWFWLIASARTYAALVAHHVSIVRRDFISIDWTKLSDSYRTDVTRLFFAARTPETLKEFDLCVLEAIHLDNSIYDVLASDFNFFFSGVR